MANLKAPLVDEIARKCIETYMKLDKNGKPTKEEWTVLSCIVKYDKLTSCFEVVSLGTGSKCIGGTKMSSKGDLLNDSHAEVIARRGFLLYLYDNIKRVLEERSSIFIYDNNKFKLKENIEFVFYSSQLPCGDASITLKSNEEDVGEVITHKRHAEDNICDVSPKKTKMSPDINRTGAKCLPQNQQDLKGPGSEYHLLGQVRIKPGRGDRTLSVSCSDKMAKWIHLGIQGRLLDMLLEPIYLKSFIFGAGVPFSEHSLERAFFKRNQDNVLDVLKLLPKIHQASVIFPHIRNECNNRPSPGSIVWIKFDDINMIHEVAVQGRKLGLTKKKATSPINSLCITKYNLYRRFLDILYKNKININSMEIVDTVPYNAMKKKSLRYLKRWEEVKEKFFRTWTLKPDIFNFCVNVT